MAYVIAEPCIGTSDKACVGVCPMDCIWGPDPFEKATMQLYINPTECIDCGACEPVCPVGAIFFEDALPEKWKHYAEINAAFFKA